MNRIQRVHNYLRLKDKIKNVFLGLYILQLFNYRAIGNHPYPDKIYWVGGIWGIGLYYIYLSNSGFDY